MLVCTTLLLAQLGAEPALYEWQRSYALLKLHSGFHVDCISGCSQRRFPSAGPHLLVVNQTLALGQTAHSFRAHTIVHSRLTSVSNVNCLHYIRLECSTGCHMSTALQDAEKSILAAAESLGMRLKPLDKKAERALVQVQLDDLRAQLADQMDPAIALSLVVPVLVMQVSTLTS